MALRPYMRNFVVKVKPIFLSAAEIPLVGSLAEVRLPRFLLDARMLMRVDVTSWLKRLSP